MPDLTPQTDDDDKGGGLIPVGLATQLGAVGSLLLYLAALLVPLLPDTGSDAGKNAAWMGTVLLVVTVAGRMLQAVAKFRDAPSPVQLSHDGAAGDGFGDIEAEIEEFEGRQLPTRTPTEDALKSTMPEDAPRVEPLPEGTLKPGDKGTPGGGLPRNA